VSPSSIGSNTTEPPEDAVAINRQIWTDMNARYADARASAAWHKSDITWGVWQVPEADLHALPPDLAGLDVVDLGCGTAYFSAWLAQRGARPVGVDPTPAQLATARRCQQELGLIFPLIEAPAERVPLPDSAFDMVLSEYGAATWADPYRWIPEAARLLRPKGRLVMLRPRQGSSHMCPRHGRNAGQVRKSGSRRSGQSHRRCRLAADAAPRRSIVTLNRTDELDTPDLHESPSRFDVVQAVSSCPRLPDSHGCSRSRRSPTKC